MQIDHSLCVNIILFILGYIKLLLLELRPPLRKKIVSCPTNCQKTASWEGGLSFHIFLDLYIQDVDKKIK